jgi:Ran GTPase-activating protein (RanGAP) involved in mRNA processing and transport
MAFRQGQNPRYETIADVRLNILTDEVSTLTSVVKDLMLVVDRLRERVSKLEKTDPGEVKDEKEKENEKEKAEKEKDEKENEKEREKEERNKKKRKLYNILSIASIFSVICVGIVWKRM